MVDERSEEAVVRWISPLSRLAATP